MKSFSRRGYRISDASTDVKLIYSFFLIFALIGFATIAVYQCDIIGWSVEAIRGHYLGSESGLEFPRSFLQILETTHFHAFTMGILYLTMAHIVIATRISSTTKILLIVGAFVATALDLLAPWGIRYISTHFIPVLLVGWIGEWLFYLGFILIPLYDMWIKPPDPEE